MPIAGMEDDQLSDILHELLTPSKEIDNPQRLFGRDRQLTAIERAFNSQGRQIFIYGDRGIGKTSVAVTAAALHNYESEHNIYVPCGETTSFADILQAIGNSVVEVSERMSASRKSGGLNLGYEGAKFGANYSKETQANIPKPANVTEALDILRYVDESREGQSIIVVDEFDRIKNAKEKALFAELIKNLPTLNSKIRFIFCGIGHSVDEILGAHPSSGRYLEAIELEKLHHNYLWDIIRGVADVAGVEIPTGLLTRISIISDGFPHFVHLIGECMFWAMQDSTEPVTKCTREHFDAGIEGALQKTEPSLRLGYQRATEKTKNKTQYEEALWALADRSDTRRQITDIYENSYRRIMSARKNRDALSKKIFNNRLLTLRGDSHGNILVGHGAGWFSFRENVFRGYVRLKAEAEGIKLKPDPT